MTMVHVGSQVVVQNVSNVERGSWTRPHGGGRAVESYRERLTKQVNALFGAGHSMVHQTLRPDALLTPEQLWKVYRESGDVRSAVESIARRVSTKDWGVIPLTESADEERHTKALQQCRGVTRFLLAPNEDDTWQIFAFKLVIDALVFYHGAIEAAYSQVAVLTEGDDGRPTVELGRGPIEEFWPVYGPSIHPVTDETGKIVGYVQDLGFGRLGGTGQDDGSIRLDKGSIIRLQLNPNTRSAYSVPIIETLVKEITTLVRSSERAMLEMDVGEVPPGFLILTGANPKVEKDVKKAAQHYRGRDQKLRIIHSPGATSPAQWLQIQRSFKEIEYLPVTAEARKLIWRLFGVNPVSQGETTDANRSDSEAMLEVDETGLFGPVLELIEGIVNMKMLPLIVEKLEGQDAEVLCRFEFDRKRRQSADEDKAQADADDTRLANGSRNINELRARDGLPPIEGGDVYRINGVPVGQDDDDDDDDDGPGDGQISDEDLDAVAPDEEEEAPGENTRGHACGEGCNHGHDEVRVVLSAGQRAQLASLLQGGNREAAERYMRDLLNGSARNRHDLPSGWQSPGLFDGVRTLNLQALWDEVVRYRKGIEPIWREARTELMAVTSAAWTANTLGNSEHLTSVGRAFETLRERWSMETLRRYMTVAENAAEDARGITENDQVGANWEAQARTYHDNAMAFLNQLIADMQSRVLANIQAVAGARAKTSAEAGLGPDSELGELLDAVEKSVDANEHRIDNWSGRLVDLANGVMAAALLEAPLEEEPEFTEGEPAPAPDPDAKPRSAEWYVSWEAVGDEGTCETCDRESSEPIRPLSTLSTMPGGQTECRARCRCVLVYWTKAEVDDGTARKINP